MVFMEPFYITTSIAYTNAPPHIGFAFELIQADAIARWQRAQGRRVWFLTGTDEHGTKIERTAKAAGMEPGAFVDGISQRFRELTYALAISNDDFIRTTDKEKHWPGVREMWRRMAAGGDLYKKKYEGLYCWGCEAFVTPKELAGGECPLHKRAPERVEEENYFFRLSNYQARVRSLIVSDEIKIIPESRKNEILSFVDQGLEDISFSRSRAMLGWGIPVPGDDSQVLYVWGDALTNYASAVGLGRDEVMFREWWPAAVHCIGKDIIRFHAVIWPAMLLSAGLPCPKSIFAHGFITVDGQKMSKTLGNVVDPFDLVNAYGADAVRYYFLRELPSTEDGDFSTAKFKERYNADLAKGLGNLVARVLAMARAAHILSRDAKRAGELADKADETKSDRYIDARRPWEGGEESRGEIGQLLYALEDISNMVEPFLPSAAREIQEQLTGKEARPLFSRLP
ncbi:MAG: methionine--tRNA ligase [Candidatus Wildermuthbacteria bacterium]|nr:methionine--tRNA ligase [Candidatus Wildermuthbacteria bacterium]